MKSSVAVKSTVGPVALEIRQMKFPILVGFPIKKINWTPLAYNLLMGFLFGLEEKERGDLFDSSDQLYC